MDLSPNPNPNPNPNQDLDLDLDLDQDQDQDQDLKIGAVPVGAAGAVRQPRRRIARWHILS